MNAISVQISQDPAGTTPERTGCLCSVCNSANASDRSARQGIALWKAGVDRDGDIDADLNFLSRHYWTNAVMHGVSDDKNNFEAARSTCTSVLRDQILILAPKVIIAGGKQATRSLHDIGLLKQPWGVVRESFQYGPYREETILSDGETATIFVTYHASARSVNQTVSRLYSDAVQSRLDTRLEQLPFAGEARNFLRRYDKQTTPGKGMRVLLLHWLDIGKAIRLAHHTED